MRPLFNLSEQKDVCKHFQRQVSTPRLVPQVKAFLDSQKS